MKTLTQNKKTVRLVIRCNPEFKRLVDMALADKQITLQSAIPAALALYLKLPANSSAAA